MRIFRFLLTDRKHPAWRVVRFVTGRGQSEQAARLRRLADFNTFLVKIYQVVDTAQDETVLMQAVCDMAVRYAHLRVAHILRPGNDQRFVRLALSGPRWWGEQQTPTIAVDHPELHGSAGRAWHSGKPVFSLSFDQTSYLAPWRELARRYGLRANASLPIFRDGKVWAVLSVCDAERGTFDSRLQVILEEAAQAISRGLERLDSRRINNALLDKATVGIAVLRGGVVEKNNICLEQLCGVGKGEMAGRSIRDFYASDDDFTRVRTAYEQLWRDGRVNVAAVRVARAEGTLVIADLTGVPLGREEDQSSVWTVEDVTRRDMNQRLYRGLLSASDAMRRGRGEMDKTRGVCEALVRDTFYNGVVVTRVDEDGLLQIVTCAGPGTTDLETSPLHATQEQRQRSLAWRVWASRASVYDNDLLADCEPRQRYDEMRARHWRAILATPVWRGDTLWGVMSFISPYENVFDAESITLCERIAGFLGLDLERMDVHYRLETLQKEEARRAREDSLTGLPNRLALSEFLPGALARAAVRGKALAVCMMDLDGFKSVNDVHGHAAGDILLKELGRRLRNELPANGYVVRLGGDEFVVVLEGLDARQPVPQITKSLDRLHKAVEVPFSVRADISVAVAMTMGVALYPSDGKKTRLLLRRADEAMYQAKQTRATRSRWWRMVEDASEITHFDAYSPEASALMSRVADVLGRIRSDFIDRFYAGLKEVNDSAQVLSTLTPAEQQRLKIVQAEHIDFLLTAKTTQADVLQTAERLGVVHALCGVDPLQLTEAYSIYLRRLIDLLENTIIRNDERHRILLIAEIRIQDDRRAQLRASQGVQRTYLSRLSAPRPAARTWGLASALEVDALASLPGVRGVLLNRLGCDGELEVVCCAGVVAQALTQALRQADVQPCVDVFSPLGQTITAKAWRTRERQSCASYALDPQTQVWHEIAEKFGVRSVLSLPLRQPGGQTAAALTVLGAYPNQFESLLMQQFASGLQQRWEQLWQRSHSRETQEVTDLRSRKLRDRLFSGGLVMYFQPVMDLNSGRLFKAEALARLRDVNGEIVPPGVFLPLLGQDEMDRLFHMGLEEGLKWLRRWDAQGLVIGLSVNMPTTYLHNARGPAQVDALLKRHGVAPQRLTVEVLETHEIDTAAQNEAIQRFKAMGVRMAIDDLGSGHSSLLRLSSLPFDVIKVDQGLLRHIRSMPLQIFSVVRSLLDIGADFHDVVVVEGLETEDIIDAMRQLGCQYGQGFGLARPMAPEGLFDWYTQFQVDFKKQSSSLNEIHSDLAALAFVWLIQRGGQYRGSGNMDDCVMARWLLTLGEEGQEAWPWLENLCYSRDAAENARLLLDWLVERIRGAAKRKAVLPHKLEGNRNGS